MANGADAEKDDLYTLASYLMRNATDAEDVVSGVLPAGVASFRQLSGASDETVAARDPEEWCNAEFARRARGEVPTEYGVRQVRGVDVFRPTEGEMVRVAIARCNNQKPRIGVQL
jgi:hypothetical protein